MGKPSLRYSNEKWHYPTDHWLLSCEQVPHLTRIPAFNDGRNLTSIKGFTYASSLDLNMGYPSILLNDKAKSILTITPFGAYECLTLPMGVMPASDIFQAQMVNLFANMGKNRPYPYIDDILHFKGNALEEHIEILGQILMLLTSMGMQVRAVIGHGNGIRYIWLWRV